MTIFHKIYYLLTATHTTLGILIRSRVIGLAIFIYFGQSRIINLLRELFGIWTNGRILHAFTFLQIIVVHFYENVVLILLLNDLREVVFLLVTIRQLRSPMR